MSSTSKETLVLLQNFWSKRRNLIININVLRDNVGKGCWCTYLHKQRTFVSKRHLWRYLSDLTWYTKHYQKEHTVTHKKTITHFYAQGISRRYPINYWFIYIFDSLELPDKYSNINVTKKERLPVAFSRHSTRKNISHSMNFLLQDKEIIFRHYILMHMWDFCKFDERMEMEDRCAFDQIFASLIWEGIAHLSYQRHNVVQAFKHSNPTKRSDTYAL